LDQYGKGGVVPPSSAGGVGTPPQQFSRRGTLPPVSISGPPLPETRTPRGSAIEEFFLGILLQAPAAPELAIANQRGLKRHISGFISQVIMTKEAILPPPEKQGPVKTRMRHKNFPEGVIRGDFGSGRVYLRKGRRKAAAADPVILGPATAPAPAEYLKRIYKMS